MVTTAAEAEGPSHAQVVSDTPGRLRVRLLHPGRHPHAAGRALAVLPQKDGVRHVTANAATGSVLVHYDRRRFGRDDVLAMLRDVGVLVVEVAGGAGEDVSESGQSTAAEAMMGATGDLDRRLRRLTGYRIDLRLLLPLGLAIAGLALAFLRGGLGLTAVPPILLLWYALDSFLFLHRSRATAELRDARA
jgi:Heavy metal associated domain 2